MTNSLLPPNATLLERALEAGGARIVDVQAPEDIDDPMTCPVSLLPWLAWGLSVDTWDADWSEQDKREAIAGSIELHRRKGTRASVETVLGRIDSLSTIVEWHEDRDRLAPHMFEVVVPLVREPGRAGGPRAQAAIVDTIIDAVGRVKPLREHLTVVQALQLGGRVGVQVAVRLAAFTREAAEMTVDTSPDWSFYLQTENGEPLQAETGAYLDTAP